MTVEKYRATVRDIQNRYEPITDYKQDSRSYFYEKEIAEEDVRILYQQNPQVGESKNFAMKLLLDNPQLKFCDRQDDKVVIYIDTETSACDGKYKQIPLPENQGHCMTIL